MSGGPCTLFAPSECTACEPRVPAWLSLVNAPGQPALRYRIGDFETFRQAMLDALTTSPVSSVDPNGSPTPAVLTSRAPDDYGVAVLELWAYVCDVLTFYQQAIANEAFLRTAVLRESLARIAGLIGYEPGRGVSATTWLAFAADKDATATLPGALQTQSIPPPGENPATFETADTLTIRASANQPVLLGGPTPALLDDTAELRSDAGGPPVTVGTRLLFYPRAPGAVSEQVVTAITPTALGREIAWRGTLGGMAASTLWAARLGRTFRFFGANAPGNYLEPSGVTASGRVKFSLKTTPVVVDPNTGIQLDGSFDGLAPGGRILVRIGTDWKVDGTIKTVEQTSASRGPVSGSCTQIVLKEALPTSVDPRTLTMFELLGPNLVLLEETNVDTINAGSDVIHVADATGLEPGTRALLVDGTNSDVVQVARPPSQASNGSWEVPLVDLLVNGYRVSAASLYGNVVQATHGETQPEQVLGSGDASAEWQEFTLAPTPVSYVPDPSADGGARSTLHVFVDGFEWVEVPSFYGRAPDDHVFVTRVDDQGRTVVRFGDGTTGRRVPTGTNNVRARVRKGLGEAGNAAADTITVLLQPQPGLKSVTNPLAAFGGTEPEPVDRLRRSAPTSVVTLGRAVSLRDYETLALSYQGGVAKARAAWAAFGSRRGVVLTIAGVNGTSVDQLVVPLRLYLDERRDPNVPLSIGGATPVPLVFQATVHVLDGWKQSVVSTAAGAALGGRGPTGSGYLDFPQLQFGRSIFPSELLAVLQDLPGVEWVELRRFDTPAAGHGFPTDVAPEAIVIGPGEIADPTVELAFAGGVNDLGGA